MIDEEIECYRDKMWRRDPELMVEDYRAAESFIESVGIAYAMTDHRWVCPSLYIAVCGRRDASMPRNVQKDAEASHTWLLKDELLRRGKVYYAKLVNKRATFIAPRLLPAFSTIWGITRKEESERLSEEASAILKVLRKEWEMASADLKSAAGISDRARFAKAIDELQACFKVIASEVLYVPKFTYIWSLTEGRFDKKLLRPIEREKALTEIARAYLTAVGETQRGELARIVGLSRKDAGIGNHKLVAEGFARRLDVGVYRLASLKE
jgi:hypothetical protein